MSLKLSLRAQYQEYYVHLHLRHRRELYFQKCWEMSIKVAYIFSLTTPVSFKASATCYNHCCKQQSFSFHMLYYFIQIR